ncbi:MAG TPA: LamG domain-containing protein, partial [Clostridia bacterium]|nr:LamG domain-containing protein [Clostridia bacterium]
SDQTYWSWDNTATYMPKTKTDESTIKMEGNGSMKLSFGPPQAITNTVALWHLEETGTGVGTTFYDSSGNNKHGIGANMPTITEGFSGKGRDFNGSSNYINLGTGLNSITTLPITVEAWVKIDSQTGSPMIVQQNGNTTNYYGFRFGVVGTYQLDISYGDGTVIGATSRRSKTTATNAVTTGQWYHLASVIRGATDMSIYINGADAGGTYTGSGGSMAVSGSGNIGRSVFATTSYFDGIIDEVRVSNSARTTEEIAEAYRAGRDHRLSRTISSTDLSSKTKLPFYVASDRQGTFLNAAIGESAFASYEPDANTVGFWHLDEQGPEREIYDSSNNNDDGEYLNEKFEGFDSQDTSFWTINATYQTIPYNLGGENVLKMIGDGTYRKFNQTTPSLTSGEEVIFDFQRTATSTWHIGALETSDGAYRWCIQEDGAGNIWVQYNDGGGWQYPKTLITSAQTGVWYTGLLRVDDTNGFYLKVWEKDDPSVNGDYSCAMPTGQTWRFASWAISASAAYIDNFKITYTDPTNITQGKIGKARYFNGSSDFIRVDDAAGIHNNSAYTLSFWVKAPSNLEDKRVFSEGSSTSNNPLLAIGTGLTASSTNSKLRVFIRSDDGVGRLDVMTNTPVFNNNWNHVVYTDNNGTYKVYVNGALDISGTYTRATTTINKATIGAIGRAAYGGFFNGIIDEFRADSVVHPADEIRQAYEVSQRTHPITIDFKAKLNSDLITGSGDTSFTIDGTAYGAQNMGDNLYAGDKIIIKEKVGATEYLAQGTVTSVTASSGAVTVDEWDTGSTVPNNGFTANSTVSKWQREYFDITGSLSTHRNTTTKVTLRITDGSSGANVWLDDFRSVGNYLTNSTGSTITSSLGKRYFQYRTIFSSNDKAVSPSLTSVTLDYEYLYTPTGCLLEEHPQDSQIIVKWNDTNTIETGYQIQKNTDGAGFVDLITKDPDSTSHTDSSTSGNHTYQYRIRAEKSGVYSDWCSTSQLDLGQGSFKFEGIRMEGVRID